MNTKSANLIIVKSFEWMRILLVTIGFTLIYTNSLTLTSEDKLNYMLLLIILPLSALTGIESIFFPNEAAQVKGRQTGSPYQTQSGMNNVAIGLTALIVWYLKWGRMASLTVLTVMLLFFCLSAINHIIEYFKQNNKKKIHLFRLIMTLLLIMVCLPLYKMSY